MLDFTSSEPRSIPEPAGSPTSTDLARAHGLDGSWTWLPGVDGIAAADDAATIWESRLFGLLGSDRAMEIPAVRGVTAWPAGTADLVITQTPTATGNNEDLDAAAAHGPLAVVVDPWLAGRIPVPAATVAFAVLLGADTGTLVPGEARRLEGSAAGLASMTADDHDAVAEASTERARRLAKFVTQIKGVSAIPLKAETGRFVVQTPRDPNRVVVAMADADIHAGTPLTPRLPEYPGSFAVTCRADHTEKDLEQYATVLASVVEP